jgi:acetoin utilization protein AcuB
MSAVVRDHEVVGMLSDRDFRSLGLSLVADMESMEKIQGRMSMAVSSLMSGDVVSVSPAATVGEIIDRMLEERVGAVPVIDEDTATLRGVVSYVDVLRALRDETE